MARHNDVKDKSQAQYTRVLMALFYQQQGRTDTSHIKDIESQLVQASSRRRLEKHFEINRTRTSKALENNTNQIQHSSPGLDWTGNHREVSPVRTSCQVLRKCIA